MSSLRASLIKASDCRAESQMGKMGLSASSVPLPRFGAALHLQLFIPFFSPFPFAPLQVPSE